MANISFNPVLRKDGTAKSCWYSGIYLHSPRNKSEMALFHAFTKEHIIPLSSALYNNLTDEQKTKNVKPCCAWINHSIKDAPASVKYELREKIWEQLGKEPNEFTKAKAKIIRQIYEEHMSEYKIQGRLVWQQPKTWIYDTPFWSTKNPHVPFKEEDIERRNEILHSIHEKSVSYLTPRFSLNEDQINIMENYVQGRIKRSEPVGSTPSM